MMMAVIISLMLVCEVKGDKFSGEEDFSGRNSIDSEEEDIKPKFQTNTGSILAAGSKFVLNCSLYQDDDNDRADPFSGNGETSSVYDISKLRIIHCTSSDRSACKVKDTKILSNSVTSLIQYNVSILDTGTYFCQYNKNIINEDDTYIRIGDYPIGAVNINCVSHDLEDLKCTWKKSTEDKNNPLPVRYKSYFKSSPMFGESDCPNPIKFSDDQKYRDDQGCSIANLGERNGGYKFLPSNKNTLCIKASNRVGSQVVKFEIDPVRIVKLSPPLVTLNRTEDRRIVFAVNQSSLTALLWIKTVVYQVVYRTSYWPQKVKEMSKSENHSIITLSDLTPYLEYTVTIRNRGLNSTGEIYWGTAEAVTHRTNAAAPQSVPVIGGYAVVDGYINVYIIPIKQWEKHSDKASYLVTVTAGSVVKYVVSWNTTTIENVTSFSESGFRLELRTKNDIGYSNNTGHLVVPPYRSDKLVPRNVIVEGTGEIFIVSWDTVTSNMKEILVYWCIGHWSKCQSDLNWMSVLPNKTETTVTTDRTADWIFAVAFIYDDGYTTEMVFSHCNFPTIDIAPSGVAAFSVIPGETQLLVNPGEFCSKKYPSKPEQYTVYYKQTAGDIKSCDQSFLKKTEKALMGKGEITLDKLAPGGHYSVCMSVMSGGGQSVISEPQKVQTLSKENNSFSMVIIASFISGFIGVLLMVFITRKLVKKYKEEDPKIELPKINTKPDYMRVDDKENTNHNEESEKFQRQRSEDSGIQLSSGTLSSPDIGGDKEDITDMEDENSISSNSNKTIEEPLMMVCNKVTGYIPILDHTNEAEQANSSMRSGETNVLVNFPGEQISSYIEEGIGLRSKDNKYVIKTFNNESNHDAHCLREGFESAPYMQEGCEPNSSLNIPLISNPTIRESLEPNPYGKKSLVPNPSIRESLEPSPYVMESFFPNQYIKESLEASPYIEESLVPNTYVENSFEVNLYVKESLESNPCIKESLEANPYFRENLEASPYIKENLVPSPYKRESLEKNPYSRESCESYPFIKDGVDQNPHMKDILELNPYIKDGLWPAPCIQTGFELTPYVQTGFDPGRRNNTCTLEDGDFVDLNDNNGYHSKDIENIKVELSSYVEGTEISPHIQENKISFSDHVGEDVRTTSNLRGCLSNFTLDEEQSVDLSPQTTLFTLSDRLENNSENNSCINTPPLQGYVAVDGFSGQTHFYTEQNSSGSSDGILISNTDPHHRNIGTNNISSSYVPENFLCKNTSYV